MTQMNFYILTFAGLFLGIALFIGISFINNRTFFCDSKIACFFLDIWETASVFINVIALGLIIAMPFCIILPFTSDSFFCSQCTYITEYRAEYCQHCGQQLFPICPEFDTVNRSDSNFCSSCGYSLLLPE